MWVQGAMYATAVSGFAHAIEGLPDTEFVENGLGQLVEADVIRSWERMDDGNYSITLPSGQRVGKYARHIEGWVSGAMVNMSAK
jgi:hypothetical protein